jgi:hypothetical protein
MSAAAAAQQGADLAPPPAAALLPRHPPYPLLEGTSIMSLDSIMPSTREKQQQQQGEVDGPLVLLTHRRSSHGRPVLLLLLLLPMVMRAEAKMPLPMVLVLLMRQQWKTRRVTPSSRTLPPCRKGRAVR